MGVLRWQWTLANRGAVEAALDSEAKTEVVSQDGRELSRAARGDKPAGHVVTVTAGHTGADDPAESQRPPVVAVVAFAPAVPICILRVDGEEVAPRVWPGSERSAAPAAPQGPTVPWLRYGVMALGIVMMIVAGLSIRAARREPPPPSGSLDAVHRAPNGLFVAHYPSDVEARRPVLPTGVGGVVLEDRGKTLSLLIAATRLDPAESHDPWTLQKRLHAEALANVSKNAADYEETARRDEPCHGRPGAVVTGRLSLRTLPLARIWSCAFVDGDAGYLVVTALAEPASRVDERRLRNIVDSFETTRLAEINETPEAPTSH